MHRLFEALRPFIRLVVQHAGWVLFIALLMSVVGLRFALQLTVDTDFSKLIPEEYPSVQAIEKLRATVGSESSVDVAIVSPEFEVNRRFAEDFIPQVMSMQRAGMNEPYFSRVDYRRETEFLKDNALYFATTAELDRLEGFLEDKIEESRLAANPFFFDLEDDEDFEEEPDSTAEALQQVYNDIVGQDYPVSEDSTTLVLRFYPTGSQTNLSFIEHAYADLDELIARMAPADFHPDMEVVTAGRLLRQLIEIQTVSKDVTSSFGAGATSVLVVVLVYFLYKAYRARSRGRFSWGVLWGQVLRMPVLALLIGIPLLMSLSWTFGVAFVRFEALNLMTSTLGLVLFGLGIDFGIHFYARYTEERSLGRSVADAIETTFISTGQAITIGAFTTAAALYILVLADFKGFSEFGFIAGTGVIFALIAMLVVMPSLLVLFERFGLLDLESSRKVDAQRDRRRYPAARGLVAGSLLAVLFALLMTPRVSFEYDFGSLEPVYESYNARRDYIRRVYDNRNQRNPAYVVVDHPDEVPAITEALRRHVEQDTLSPTVREIESMQDRFPTKPADRERRLERLSYIRSLLEDPFLAEDDSEDMNRLRRAAQTENPIDLEDVPDFLKTQYTSKSGEIGNFVVIYPSVGLSDGRQSIAFSEDVGRIETADGRVYHAGSTSLVAADMLKLMQKEAPWMVFATFVIVLLLMMVNFRSVRWAVLATIPLIVGVLWMLLLMELLELNLNFYNLIVLPAVLGIGNDAGVHIVHRYREEGAGSIMNVLRSTGEHVAMGSLTTMIGFAGLLLSFHPGLHSIGVLAVIGIGATLLSALVFLPALLQWIEKDAKLESELRA